MSKYDIMIEYRVSRTGTGDEELDKGLDLVTHRMRHVSAVVTLHGDVLALEAEVEASGPHAAVSNMDARLRMELRRAECPLDLSDVTSFWATDTERIKAQLLLLKSKTA